MFGTRSEDVVMMGLYCLDDARVAHFDGPDSCFSNIFRLKNSALALCRRSLDAVLRSLLGPAAQVEQHPEARVAPEI